VTVIGGDPDDENDFRIPVPHSYFKGVLTEERKGRRKGWTFIMLNGLRDFWSEPKLEDRRKVPVRKPGQEEAAGGIDWGSPPWTEKRWAGISIKRWMHITSSRSPRPRALGTSSWSP
jgi:hypothetical protein